MRGTYLPALLSAALLSACGSRGTSPAQGPASPANLSASPTDGAVTLSWSAVPGAAGYRVYFGKDALGLPTKSWSSLDAGAALTVTVTGLVNGVAYRFAVAARADVEGELSGDVVATPRVHLQLAVSSVTPSDGATGVSRVGGLSLTFDRSLTGASATANSAAGPCTGSLHLSADGFVTCAALVIAVAGPIASLVPVGPLAGLATYRLRATTALLDDEGLALPAPYTSGGFVTDPGLQVTSVSPDSVADVDFLPELSVVFSLPANPATIVANTTDTACSGALQLSADGFVTCARMAAPPAASAGNRTFTLRPAASLRSGATYRLRVTPAALDALGQPLERTFTSAGFTIKAFAVTSLTPADGAAARSRLTPVVVTFNRPVSAASLTVNAAAGPCSGSVALSADGFSSCAPLLASASGAQVTLTPAAPLGPVLVYRLRVSAALLDDGGSGLPSPFISAGFTTGPGLQVSSVSPESQTGLDFQPTVTVAFAAPAKDASVTTNTADGACSGALQLSRDGFASCARMAARPVSTDGGVTFTARPAGRLASGATYRIRLSTAAQSPAGEPLDREFTSVGFAVRLFAVTGVTPAGGASAVSRLSPITLSFNRDVGAASATANASAGPCVGSLQVSADGFSSCVPLSVGVSGGTATLTPAPVLPGAAALSVRATTALLDDGGGPLPAAFTSAAPFTTRPALVVSAVQPAGGALLVPVTTQVTVAFNVPLSTGTVTAATTGAACSGSVQLSSDGFATCLPMTGPSVSGDGLSFTFTPAASLAANTQQRVRVTPAVQDPVGTPLDAPFLTAPFTTSPVVDVSFPVASGSPGVPLLPALKNVQASVDDDRVSVTFEPVLAARDYRIYPLPKGPEVQVSADGTVAIQDALYRCAGDRFAVRAAKDGDPGPANGWTTTWVNRTVAGFARTEAAVTLGHVFAEPGAGRLPVYAMGDPVDGADNACGGEIWAASRRKLYTVSTTERAQLLAQGWRDDGVAFYAPAAGSVAVKTAVSGGVRLYFSATAEVAARAGLSPATAFTVLSAATTDTVPLDRVYYSGGCGGSHDELVTAGGYQRALTQTAQPFYQVQWSGLTQETVLVVEALDTGCPFQGHLSPASRPAAGFAQPFVTIADVRSTALNGAVFVNGQHEPANTPKAIARTFVKVKPAPRPAMEWSAGFGPSETWNFTVTGVVNNSYQDLTLAGNGTDAQLYRLEPGTYALGVVGGELWIDYADAGADLAAKFRLTPRQTATMGASGFVHGTMMADFWSTGRRYAQLIISDAAVPLQTPGNLEAGTTLILQTRGPWPFDVELQSCDHRTWDVNNQCPRYKIGHQPFGGARWAPTPLLGERAGPAQLVRFDLYVSRTKAYVLVDNRPFACANLLAAPAVGPVHVTFGDVLYHSGVDEPVVAKPTGYQFLFDKMLTQTRRQFDNLGFESAAAAPQWDEALIPCATATDP